MSAIAAILMLTRTRIARLCVLFALTSSIAVADDIVDPPPSNVADLPSPSTAVGSAFQPVSSVTQLAAVSTTQDGEFVQKMTRPRGAASSEYPPSYQLLRYNENYEYLKDPALRSDAWDFLKYVPMMNRDGWYASFGGETRQRIETINNDGVGLLPYADTYYQQRYLLHGDFHFGKFVRFFGQMQSGFIDGRDAGPRPDIDRNTIDAHQAFADVVVPIDGDSIDESITLRMGRQEMAYGSGRLIDVREGPTLRRSFDGARFLAKADKVSIDGWWTRPVRNEFGAFDDSPDPGHQFWGLYGTSPALLRPSGHLDLYYLGFEADSATYEQGTGREVRHSLGTRIWGAAQPWEYNCEYVWQFGTFASLPINAWTAAQAVRYNFSDRPFKPRPGVRFDFASGNHSPTSSTLGTFNPLFPSGVYFNLANPVGPKNMIDLHPTLDLYLSDQVTVTADWSFFWRESTGDGVYTLSGSLLRPANGSDARYVGNSPSLTLNWNPTRHISVIASYVYFSPGSFFETSPPDKPMNFFTSWVTYRF